MYQQKRSGANFPIPANVLQSPQGWFEGGHFTEHEIDDAAQFLRSQGLVESGTGAKGLVLRGEITPDGEQVVEEHGSSLQAAGAAERGGGQQIVTHFHGTVSGQVGIGQVQQTQNVGVNPELIATLLADVREAASTLEPADQAYVGTYVDLIQAEASRDDPSAEMVRTSGDRVKAIAEKVGNVGLSAAMSALMSALAKIIFGM